MTKITKNSNVLIKDSRKLWNNKTGIVVSNIIDDSLDQYIKVKVNLGDNKNVIETFLLSDLELIFSDDPLALENLNEAINFKSAIIKQCAKKARDYIVSKYGTDTDLCGKCIEASDYLIDLLSDANIPAKVVEGYIIYDNDENCSDRAWDEHTWVELSDRTVVDVTVEQFNPMMDVDYPPILIQKNPHGYVYDKPRFLWLEELNERLTTQISRRDNPNDFSPFGYKVNFYDGDKHIGEGSVCGIKDDNAFLYDFEVYPEFRGKGYSKEMLQYLIDQYDLKQLFVKPDNTIAINLYKKYGFKFDDSAYDSDDIGNMRLMVRESIDNNLQAIVNSIYKEYVKYDKGEGLNQNCMLCAWAVELQLRGYDFLPRPVYSPRDSVFDIKGEELVIKPEVLKINSKEDIETQVLEAGAGARFYCHVNWADSKGGHEFLLINDNESVLVVDSQAKYIKEINKDKKYFDDINFENSYIVRFDNKEINQDILKYNAEDQILKWNDEVDSKLLEESFSNNNEFFDSLLDELSEFDYAFIDADGEEHLKEHLTLELDFKQVPEMPDYLKKLMDMSNSITTKYPSSYNSRYYELAKELYLTKGCTMDEAMQLSKTFVNKTKDEFENEQGQDDTKNS